MSTVAGIVRLPVHSSLLVSRKPLDGQSASTSYFARYEMRFRRYEVPGVFATNRHEYFFLS
jgi:hypothetical protein